jgi:hypothetical protein
MVFPPNYQFTTHARLAFLRRFSRLDAHPEPCWLLFHRLETRLGLAVQRQFLQVFRGPLPVLCRVI